MAPFEQTQGVSYLASHAPYVIQYNLTVQREIVAHTVASLGYVGSHGVHLFTQENENLPIPCSAASAPLPPWCPGMLVRRSRVSRESLYRSADQSERFQPGGCRAGEHFPL